MPKLSNIVTVVVIVVVVVVVAIVTHGAGSTLLICDIEGYSFSESKLSNNNVFYLETSR